MNAESLRDIGARTLFVVYVSNLKRQAMHAAAGTSLQAVNGLVTDWLRACGSLAADIDAMLPSFEGDGRDLGLRRGALRLFSDLNRNLDSYGVAEGLRQIIAACDAAFGIIREAMSVAGERRVVDRSFQGLMLGLQKVNSVKDNPRVIASVVDALSAVGR